MIILVLQEKEFLKMFKIPVIEVPTNLSNIRMDLPIQAFAVRLLRSVIVPNFFLFYDERKLDGYYYFLQTVRGKWQYVREEVEFMFQLGRPVLVGTTRYIFLAT